MCSLKVPEIQILSSSPVVKTSCSLYLFLPKCTEFTLEISELSLPTNYHNLRAICEIKQTFPCVICEILELES